MFTRSTGLIIACCWTISAIADVIYVDDDAPGDPGPGTPDISDPREDGSFDHPFDAIQEALDAAVDGDEIIVTDGLYVGTGNRNLTLDDSVTLRSDNGPADCTIDCEGAARAFILADSVATELEIIGFTVANGNAGDFGGALFAESGPALQIIECVFQSNTATFAGGAIYATGTQIQFDSCSFLQNSAVIAPALYTFGGTLDVTSSVFISNTGAADGACFNDVNNVGSFSNCLFAANISTSAIGGGGAVLNNDARLCLTNCTLVGNSSVNTGGGLWIDGGTVEVVNCILWDNMAPVGSQISIIDGGFISASFSDVQGGETAAHVERGSTLVFREGNLDVDPEFVDPGAADYQLSDKSSCVDAGSSAAVPRGIMTDLSGGSAVSTE